MPQYPVPQFIEEESKIVFFMTFRQFFLLVGGGVVCFLLFLALPLLIFAICAVIVMALVSIIAFVKINNQSVIKALFNYMSFTTGPKNYIWKKNKK